jgi:DNA-binding response OmpR family regulator
MKTRSLVLLKAGYAVREAITISQAIKVFGKCDFDLFIVCHSIPDEERIELIRAIRAMDPSAKIVVIRRNGGLSATIANEPIHSLDGPAALLTAVAHALDVKDQRFNN